MKLKQLIATGVAGVLLSQSALALQPDVDAIDLEVRLSGATATENALTELLRNDLCASAVSSYDGLNQKAVHCTMTTASVPGLSGTLNVFVRKSSIGGSGNGVGPVCNGTGVGFLTIDTVLTGTDTDTANCWDDGLLGTARGALAVPTQTSLGPDDPTLGDGRFVCLGTPTASLVPIGGLSDVKPNEVFSGASANCGANAFPIFETIFGIPVSRALYDALQEAQGVLVGSCVAGDMEDECMPSLTTQTVGGLISGQIKTWSELLIDGDPLYGNTTVTPASDLVTYCRRSLTSGTFASNEIRILQRSCIDGARTSVLPPGDAVNGPVVPGFQSGSDNVEQCLDALSNTGVFGAFTGSNWALGHNSLDRNPETSTSAQDDWRFIKLDGVAPSYVNVANGSYRFTVSSTIQWPDGTPVAAPTGNTLTILQALRTDGADPASLGAARVAHDFGDSGLMALAELGNALTFDPVTGAYDTTVPVTPWSHVGTGGILTNCLEGVVPAAPNNEPIPLEQ